MAVKRFTEEEMELLRKNPYTYRVTYNMLLLTVEFKEKFWKLYLQGFSPVSIFKELGYDPNILGAYRINNFTFKLKKAMESGKPLTQGVGGEVKPPPKNKNYSDLPFEAAIASMQYELSYLRQEVDFLKKAVLFGQIRLAREISLGLSNRKFQLIHDLVSKPDNQLKVSHLCKLAHVTRSGYYNWLSNMDSRNEHEQKDRADFSKILEAYKFKGYDKGIRGIHMRLLHLEKPVLMNLKKIRRLMVKYNLRCPIRKPNPYRQMVRALRTNKVAPNLLNREFKEHGPRKVLLTDITYIPLNDKYCYLSTILDSYTMQVLGYCLSDSLAIDFVLETVNMVLAKHGNEISSETIIHSDQGSHYTSYKFMQLVHDANLRQSMSRRGNCWDNAPQESFYGHMKDEIHISKCKDFEALRAEIDRWMDYYNNDRYQWKLAKLSPNEYYEYVKTGLYPLRIF